MQAVFVIISILIVIGAVIGFVRTPRMSRRKATTRQMAIAIFQMGMCGSFFAMSLSDFLDLGVDYTWQRFVMMILYDTAYLMLIIYVVGFSANKNSAFLRYVIYACIVLMTAQTLIFPYGSESPSKRYFELVAGLCVIVLLVVVAWKMQNPTVGSVCFLVIILLELAVAIWNVIDPLDFVVNDIQQEDVPLNYVMLFLRPVLFTSLSVAYRAWLDRHGYSVESKKNQ